MAKVKGDTNDNLSFITSVTLIEARWTDFAAG